MNRKELINLLESWIYPEGTTGSNFSYVNNDGVMVFLSIEEVQREFEKLLTDIDRE